jgi:hypothetical protein
VIPGSACHSRHGPAGGARVGTDLADEVNQFIDAIRTATNKTDRIVAVS